MDLFDRYIQDEELKLHLRRLYKLRVFRVILNVMLSLLIGGRLSFDTCRKRFSESQDGVCKTYMRELNSRLYNSIFYFHKYRIEVKVMSDAVIIHEIAHAVEKESGLDVNVDFHALVLSDMKKLSGVNIMARQAIEKIMINEVNAYPAKSHASERFARYFELFTLTKEVLSSAKFVSEDLISLFADTNDWVKQVLEPRLKTKVFSEVTLFDRAHPSIASFASQWRSNVVSGVKSSWAKQHKSLFDD